MDDPGITKRIEKAERFVKDRHNRWEKDEMDEVDNLLKKYGVMKGFNEYIHWKKGEKEQ